MTSSTIGISELAIALGVYFLMAILVSRWSYVVATKLPTWLNQDWRHQAESFLEKQDAAEPPAYAWWTPRANDADKPSRALLRWLPVIGPVVSKEYVLAKNDAWLLAVTFLLATLCAPIDALAGIAFFGVLRCASMVDAESQLLPDCLTLPLMWLGLSKAAYTGDIQTSLMGAMFGFMLLWSLQKGYFLLKKVDGMGGGDLKIAAAIGAWVGLPYVPGALLVGSFIGIGYAIAGAIKNKGFGRFAFGPSLALGGIAMYFPGHLLEAYRHLLPQ